MDASQQAEDMAGDIRACECWRGMENRRLTCAGLLAAEGFGFYSG